jgi:hypothetical protein
MIKEYETPGGKYIYIDRDHLGLYFINTGATGPVPKTLEGLFTRLPEAERAVAIYIANGEKVSGKATK